jgi:asparagine synthase (glutamine-hydrolysing)
MSAIAGITNLARRRDVARMIDKLSHRGRDEGKVIAKHGAVIESSWHQIERRSVPSFLKENSVWGGCPPSRISPTALAQWPRPFALAATTPNGLFMARDQLGVKPLYYGDAGGDLCFASEVKALLTITSDINEFPPGHYYTPDQGFQRFARPKTGTLPYDDAEKIVTELRRSLESAIARNVVSDTMGVWLSGGVDSSVIATLAKKQVRELHSFVIGLEGATDLKYGGQVAELLGTRHHPFTVTLAELLPILPSAIYALESFDALLVRSSITNYLISKIVADYVGAIFSGEGGDELFAGYAYMKEIPAEQLPAALEEAVGRLHNTALQRVDRSACAQGILPYIPFADAEVVEYALRIPAKYKIYRRGKIEIEKWILRKTIEGKLPSSILWRPKTKFWQGTGLKELLHDHAESKISDSDFRRERRLPNGWRLNSKEELMYYRIFTECFGDLEQVDWMGRTKGAPAH